MNKLFVFGWTAFLAGCAVWVYGYVNVGHPAFMDWQAQAPWWIADFLPNREAELGLLLCFISMIPMYWPTAERE